MRGRQTFFIDSPTRAGLTLGGLAGEKMSSPTTRFGARVRPARHREDVPRGAPGHVPRTIQVSVLSISAALACEGSPRTSGRSAAAPAAVAGRTRRPEGLHAQAAPGPLVAHHVLPTPEGPGVKSSVPCCARLPDFVADPRERLERDKRRGELRRPPDEERGPLLEIRLDGSRLPVLHRLDSVPAPGALQGRTGTPSPATFFVEPAYRDPEGPEHRAREIAGDGHEQVAGYVQIDTDRGEALRSWRDLGLVSRRDVQKQITACVDNLAVRGGRLPDVFQRTRCAGDPQPDRRPAHGHLGPVLSLASKQSQRARDVEPQGRHTVPVGKPTRTTALPLLPVGGVGLVGFVAARLRQLRAEADRSAQVPVDEPMQCPRITGPVLLGLLDAEVEAAAPRPGHQPEKPADLPRVRSLHLERVGGIAHRGLPPAGHVGCALDVAADRLSRDIPRRSSVVARGPQVAPRANALKVRTARTEVSSGSAFEPPNGFRDCNRWRYREKQVQMVGLN